MSTETQKIKYFLYCRKSSEAEDRQVASIEAQIDELEKLSQNLKLEIVDIIRETKSAKAPGRQQFNSMIARIDKGEAQGIICWKLDRLSRNPVDGGLISWMLQQNTIRHIQTYGGSYYPTDNVVVIAVELGVANQYVRDLSVNVKRGFRKKLQDGNPTGMVPQGYLNSMTLERGSNVTLKDNQRYPLVRRMWTMMLSGNYNPQEILKIANGEWGYKTLKRKKLGGKALSRSSIYQMFTNPFYYGFLLEHKTGELHQGSHEPMVSKEEFDKVQILLGSKGMKRAPHTKQFAHTAQIACATCGCQICAHEKFQIICSVCKFKYAYNLDIHPCCPKCKTKVKDMKKPKILHYVYYGCSRRKNTETFCCAERSIQQEELEGQIKKYLSTITIRQEYVDWALKHLEESKSDKAQTKVSIAESLEKALADVEKRLDGLVEMRSLKELSQEEFLARKQPLDAERQRIRDLVAKQKKSGQNGNFQTTKALTFAERALREYDKGDLHKKREILAELGSNLTLSAKNLSVSAEEPFQILVEATKCIADLNPMFEPAIQAVNKREKHALGVLNPTWLDTCAQVRTKIMEKFAVNRL